MRLLPPCQRSHCNGAKSIFHPHVAGGFADGGYLRQQRGKTTARVTRGGFRGNSGAEVHRRMDRVAGSTCGSARSRCARSCRSPARRRPSLPAVPLTMPHPPDIPAREADDIDSFQHSLRALVQSSPLAILELNREAKVRLWNPAAERMFGWAESEVLGRANPLVPEEARSQYEADVLLLLQGETIRGKVVRRQHKDGRRLDVRLWAAPIRAPQSGTIGITAGLEDITEERENERKLRASEARQEAMEAELQRSEERMRLAFDAAKIRSEERR